MSNYAIETKCAHEGYNPGNGEPRIAPIVQSTTYKYDSADDVAALFDLAKAGHMYTRISNPTSGVLEAKIAALEGGVGALAVSSGQAATLTAIITICNAGEHIVAMNNLYGGTYTLINSTLKKFGIEATFVDFNAPDEVIQNAIQANTKLVSARPSGIRVWMSWILNGLPVSPIATDCPYSLTIPLPHPIFAGPSSGGRTSLPTQPPSTWTDTPPA